MKCCLYGFQCGTASDFVAYYNCILQLDVLILYLEVMLTTCNPNKHVGEKLPQVKKHVTSSIR